MDDLRLVHPGLDPGPITGSVVGGLRTARHLRTADRGRIAELIPVDPAGGPPSRGGAATRCWIGRGVRPAPTGAPGGRGARPRTDPTAPRGRARHRAGRPGGRAAPQRRRLGQPRLPRPGPGSVARPPAPACSRAPGGPARPGRPAARCTKRYDGPVSSASTSSGPRAAVDDDGLGRARRAGAGAGRRAAGGPGHRGCAWVGEVGGEGAVGLEEIGDEPLAQPDLLRRQTGCGPAGPHGRIPQAGRTSDSLVGGPGLRPELVHPGPDLDQALLDADARRQAEAEGERVRSSAPDRWLSCSSSRSDRTISSVRTSPRAARARCCAASNTGISATTSGAVPSITSPGRSAG